MSIHDFVELLGVFFYLHNIFGQDTKSAVTGPYRYRCTLLSKSVFIITVHKTIIGLQWSVFVCIYILLLRLLL